MIYKQHTKTTVTRRRSLRRTKFAFSDR